ncbi:MAG: sigma-70 family RNA polymerase sigma factor [Pseudomonadota bacterium]|uniref:RNA polymerase sigma factor n=1 Tax=unclassified Phenylobacterium TaxID=2640670 RepID=UPI0006FA3FAE|nr:MULTISPECIES: sigma-70 family RNA polymerase sigma factor [unclassified Phenylobacterium]KRB39929.1 RNA polymerase subunit sigma-70 [Phenylobacterium sp. Root700]MBT9469569.1 sigma-70 family RNA polymerase sigma factor [Phenylobacterium sp.]
MSGSQNTRLANLHDVELATLAATGDRSAFGELVRRHGSAVRGLLRRMGAPAAEADDVAQDAFLIAFERISEFRGQGAFAGWVKKISARQYLRRLQRERRLASLAVEAEDDAPVASFRDTGDRIDLDEALRSLGPAERVCVSMCYGAGLSHAEAADALNLPLGTVKSHVKRGLEKLRARLAPGADALPEGRRDNG